MPFISYAQNFEDVLLWRALGHVERGFYIDVGAHHPDLDSVTRAFSDRGWHGINIEPQAAQAALIRSARPRDVTLQVAVGAATGTVPFHVVPGTGLSTLDREIARSYEAGSFTVETETVEMLTLATICALHAEPVIHFLKIDVEGAELAVLQGADLQRFRPWIILAEATAPRSTEQIHQSWEPLLLAADYQFVWFDGLNRFYVAAERADALRGAFATPPNVFDDFVRAGDNSWIARFDAAANEASALGAQVRSAALALEQSAERERRHAEHAGHEIDRLRLALAKAETETVHLRDRIDTAEHLFALRHRDMEELHASRHEARHELQQTHLRLQAAERDHDLASQMLRHELQQTHLRLQSAEQERDGLRAQMEAAERDHDHALHALRHELQQTHLRLQATEQERDGLRAQMEANGPQPAPGAGDIGRLAAALRRRQGGIGRMMQRVSERTRVSDTPSIGPATAPRTDPNPSPETLQKAGPALAGGDKTAPDPQAVEDAAPAATEPDTVGDAEPSSNEQATTHAQDALVAPTHADADADRDPSEAGTSTAADQAFAPLPVTMSDAATDPDQAASDAAPPLPIPPPPPATMSDAADPDQAAPDTAPPLPIFPPPPLTIVDGEADGLRTVHQFHSGSAVGDAITNALLMVRGMLRAMGYHSEIFVEQPPVALAHELRTFEELPRHDDYVLLVHHSMGYDRFDQVLALPARKVLVYHNITPSELLARQPVLAHYAALGRTQLARFHGQVAAALAISGFNAHELRRIGLAPVRTCTLLFDIERLRANAAEAAGLAATMRRDGVFTVLFVGRIADSKNQLALIDAYAAFRRRHEGPSRLVMVGRADTPDDPYLALLQRRIAETGLADEAVLTGGVSDAVLNGWYGAADLYVSLSRHEGFGVPLVEAMVHGVPVLAFGAGAVPSTLGGAARLVPDLSPDAVAGQMLALSGDPAARDRQRAAQFRSLERFALPRQARVLQDALLRAGAALPPDASGSAGGEADPLETLRFSVTGHVNGSYSLAAINRGLALALEAARPGRVRLLPVEGTPTLDLAGVPPAQSEAIRALALRPPHETGPELVISQHYPVLVPREGPDLAVALLFWEESRLPADTVALLGRHFDAVVAPTRFVRDVLVESGLPIPVRVIPPALDLHRFAALGASRREARSAGASPVHRFLHVSSCFPRKGVDVLLRAWAAAFRAGDPVRLVIKGFPNPHNEVAAQLDALRLRDPEIAPVELLDRDMDDDALLALYVDADTMVLPTRGEGLNLPAAEALAAGLGLIVTGAGGHMDFCLIDDDPDRIRDGVRLLRFALAPSGSHLATPHSLWLEPDEADLVAALRERVAAAPAPIDPLVLAGPDAIAQAYGALAADLLRAGPRRPVRMSWVSSAGVRCGVAEYSRQMLAALQRAADNGDPVPRVRVLADRRTPVNRDDPDAAWPCWTVGDPATLIPLAAAIAADDADAVMLQHQPGLFSFGVLADLLHHPSLDGRVVMATLHNTVDLELLDADVLARVLGGLGRIDRVLVHTVADLRRLGERGLRDRVTLLPHGVPPALPPGPIRDFSEQDDPAPRIGCYGFFLPGKGIDVLVEAFALLKRRWPAAELRLVNAEYDAAVSSEEIARCRAMADALGIADSVMFETGFLPNHMSFGRLSECDVVALAHRPSREASSAALRGAMAAGMPVAVTPVALFDEAENAVFRFEEVDAEAIAAGLDRLLADAALRARLQNAAQDWMRARQWGSVARQVGGMAMGLVRTARLRPGT